MIASEQFERMREGVILINTNDDESGASSDSSDTGSSGSSGNSGTSGDSGEEQQSDSAGELDERTRR